MDGGGFDDNFNIDKQEYQSVFKVFDKNNTGEINISQVYELINKFDQAQKLGEGGAPANGQSQALGAKSKNPGEVPLKTQGTAGVGGQKVSQVARAGVQTGGIQNAQLSNKNQVSPATKKAGGAGGNGAGGFGAGGMGLQLKPTSIDPIIASKSPRMVADKPGGVNMQKQTTIGNGQQQPLIATAQNLKDGQHPYIFEDADFGNVPLLKEQEDKKSAEQLTFPNGKTTLKFEDFFSIVKESCSEKEQAENYLIHAFSMFDRKKKGYINNEDLKEVFKLLGETVTDDEVNTMIKIAGVKSNDKINFKEFVDFFNKVD